MPPPTIQGRTQVFFVVADPVAQVKAPQVYNHLFARAGIDAVMVPAQARTAQLAGFARQAMALGNCGGLVASIPHKTALVDIVDRLDAAARAAGAVNAVRRAADGALEGALFDGTGFVGALAHLGVAAAGRRVLLVGTGGAGLAIASALAALPLAELAAFDVDGARTAALVQRIGAQAAFAVRAVPQADPAGFDLVVNATPLGLHPGDALPFEPARLAPGAAVVDILMTGEPTALLQACRARGIAAHAGHEMLIHQVPAYLEFFGFAGLAQELRAGGPAMEEVRSMLRGSLAAL